MKINVNWATWFDTILNYRLTKKLQLIDEGKFNIILSNTCWVENGWGPCLVLPRIWVETGVASTLQELWHNHLACSLRYTFCHVGSKRADWSCGGWCQKCNVRFRWKISCIHFGCWKSQLWSSKKVKIPLLYKKLVALLHIQVVLPCFPAQSISKLF